MKKKTEQGISPNGTIYHINPKKKTAKKIYSSLKQLKEIGDELDEICKINFNAYLSAARDQLSGIPIKVDKNSFTVKDYKFIFYTDHIECRDLLNYGAPIIFPELLTAKQLVTFVTNAKPERKFTPVEMIEAVQLGKALKEEKKIDTSLLPKIQSKESLEDARKKALRLIERVKKRQTSWQKILQEIPGMIKYQRLNIAIGIAIKMYHDKKLAWGHFLNKIETLITDETFEKKLSRPEKFTGVDIMKYKMVGTINKKAIPTIMVDNHEREAGEFLCRYLMQRDRHPEVYVALRKWLNKEITDNEFIDNPIQKDKMQGFELRLLKGLTLQQVEVIEEVFAELDDYLPSDIIYNDGTFKKGQKIRIYFKEEPSVYIATITSVDKGVWYNIKEGDPYAIIHNQKFKIVS